jgi:hypothetical protein
MLFFYYKTSSTCSACLVCGDGKRETTACSSTTNRVCTQNDCTCQNGVQATGTACTSNGANICTECESGHYKTGINKCTACRAACESDTGLRETTPCSSAANRVCTQNVCTCTNGVKATGTACWKNGHICTSCSGDYYKTSSTCSACLVCGNGERETSACSSAANRVCTQISATCAQRTDGSNGGPFTCTGSTSLRSNSGSIKCGATPCAANSDATENARCCNQATCAQKTDGTIGGSFSCAVGTILKSNPGNIESSNSGSISAYPKMPDDCLDKSWNDRSCYPRKAVDELSADGSGTHATYGPVKDWDMSEVTDISGLFNGKGTMNADLSSWDVSRITKMYRST